MSLPPVPDPPSGRLSLDEALACARETRGLLVGNGVLARVAEQFQRHFPGRRAVLVADETTHALAGRTLGEGLAAAGIGCLPAFRFADRDLHAEITFVERLEAALRGHDAIAVALGAGTLNDLAKLASHRVGRSYLCVATAASMDGYTASGASITAEGSKRTFPCPAPRAVVADLALIRQAPPEMTASGYADLLAKVTAGADWITAEALGAEPIDPTAWTIVQGSLRDALADPAGARAGREPALGRLVEGLMLGGFAMQWSQSSRPASGAEHQFSHLWDMEHHVHRGAAPSHGFKVGVATLALTRFYAALLELPLDRIDPARLAAGWPSAEAAEADVRRRFAGTDFMATAVTETLAKHPEPAALAAQLERLRAVWPDLRRRLLAQLLPVADAAARLAAAGAPVEPEEIGISRARLRDTFRRAGYIRRRFTVLDLAVRAGVLEPLLDGLFGPGGPWDLARDGGEAA